MNRYLVEPDLAELRTEVANVTPAPGDGWLVATRENLFRPSGGGQPDDHGSVEINGIHYPVAGLSKGKGGLVYAHLPGLGVPPSADSLVVQHLDIERRQRLRRLHTLQHLLSSAAVRIAPEAVPCGTGLGDDANVGWIRLLFPTEVNHRKFTDIDGAVRRYVAACVPVIITHVNSVEDARTRYSRIFRMDPSLTLSGKVRVVVLGGIDANCCSGTHWHSTAVGEYRFEVSVEREVSSAGYLAELRFELTEMRGSGPSGGFSTAHSSRTD